MSDRLYVGGGELVFCSLFVIMALIIGFKSKSIAGYRTAVTSDFLM